MNQIEWQWFGIPDQQGVFNVGGRLGAGGGPEAFMREFSAIRGKTDIHQFRKPDEWVKDLTTNIEHNHLNVIERLKTFHEQGGQTVSVVLGGGHDHGYSQLAGVRQGFAKFNHDKPVKLGCINLDAHLDLRSTEKGITSASPFYLAIEKQVIEGRDLIEFGIQKHCNRPELWDYAAKQGVVILELEEIVKRGAIAVFEESLRRLEQRCDHIVISWDLDVCAQSVAPGVSAPQARGISAEAIFECLRLAGKSEKVISLGVFELNPEHDLDRMTARLAAQGVWYWLDSKLQVSA